MRILLTGGAGFLGSHLCDRLLDEGHELIVMDNLLTGRAKNIAHLFGQNGFTFIKHDVTQYIYVKEPLDYVLHFASPASPDDFSRYPIRILKVGAHGTHNALGVARAKKAKFFLASTSEIYGDPLVHPQPESYLGNVNTLGVRGVYDEAKRFAEAMTMAYHRESGIDTRIVRIFNTYGPRMRKNDGRAIPNFVNRALADEPLKVYGDGSQTRSICYVSDLIEGIYRLMHTDYHAPVNIGNPSSETSMLDLAKKIIELTESKSEIALMPNAQIGDDPQMRQPDITLAKKLLGWEPKVTPEQGLRQTIEWFREN
ncbi:MAG: SDR family oxidoreductase [Gemmatimonadetes bacterium]|nr:SDR family oxidoreductase [Gemmatimonadota bacterium]